MARVIASVSVLIVTLVVGVVAGGMVARGPLLDKPRLSTPYHGVLLTNGQAYFGKLEGIGSAYPVLTDVFYVQTRVDPETKKSNNVLVKRGREWHAPDRMVLNAAHILLIEPVSEGSPLAKIIADAKP